MDRNIHFSFSTCTWFALFALVSDAAFANANFNITPVPNTSTAVTIYPNEVASVYYTVTNNTHSTRAGYTLQALPTSVKQNTSKLGSCQNPITLTARSSCTLQLDVTASTQSSFALCYQTSCTTAASPFSVVQVNNTPPALAVGTYMDSTTQYPLAATSAGNNWLFTLDSSQPSLPSDFAYSTTGITTFSNASCSGQTCIAAGVYQSNLSIGPISPLVATSSNGGTSWLYTLYTGKPSAQPSAYLTFDNLIAANCSGSFCAVGGAYTDTSLTTYPVIAVSTNGGFTWGYTFDRSSDALPVDYNSNGGIASISCQGHSCVGAGSYSARNGNTYPLLVTSTDGGVSWTNPVNSGQPNLPNNYSQYAAFSSVSCSGLTCVAAGSYTTPGSNTYPLAATSTDGGKTWGYTIDSSKPATQPTGYSNGNGFNSVSCTGQTCVAVGYYNNSFSSQYPMIATSTDGGNTWAYTMDSTQPLPGDDTYNVNTLGSASCSGLTCIAAGTYQNTDNNNYYPLVANSTDGGKHWTWVMYNGTPALPSDAANGINSSLYASCTGLICTVAGSYPSTYYSTNSYPLIATSTNGGNTWNYTLYSSTPSTPPTGYQAGGNFTGVSTSAY